MAGTSILVRCRQWPASSGVQTSGPFWAKRVLRSTGNAAPACVALTQPLLSTPLSAGQCRARDPIGHSNGRHAGDKCFVPTPVCGIGPTMVLVTSYPWPVSRPGGWVVLVRCHLPVTGAKLLQLTIDHSPSLPRQRDLFLHQKLANRQRIHLGAQPTIDRFVGSADYRFVFGKAVTLLRLTAGRLIRQTS